MDRLRTRGFLVLLFTTLFALQFAEARVLDRHIHSDALSLHNSADLDGSAESSLHKMLSSHSNPGIGHISVKAKSEGNNILSSSGQSPGVGHWEKSKHSTSPARTTPNSVLSSGPSPGVGNFHTSATAGTQSELGTFNKLPSGPSPGVGHKVTTGYTEMAQESESKKSATMMNILPSGPSPGVGHSATNGRNMIEKISTESESKKEIAFTQESESKKISEFMNILPSGPSPGVGHSATNGRNTMEKMTKKDEGAGMGIIKTFNKLPSRPSPGVGHSYSNALLPDKIPRATRGSEDTKGSDHSPIIHKLPGGPSPGGGHSYVEKSASTVRMQLSSNAVLIKSSSSPSRGDGNSSENKLRPARRNQKQTGGALDQKIGCDGGGLDFYGTPSPPMFGIAAGRS